MFIVRKKNKLSHAGVDFYNSYNLSYVCYQGFPHYKTVYELAGKKTYDHSICYPYKHDCYSMCDFKSTQWSVAMSLKASTSNEQLHRLISILRL